MCIGVLPVYVCVPYFLVQRLEESVGSLELEIRMAMNFSVGSKNQLGFSRRVDNALSY